MSYGVGKVASILLQKKRYFLEVCHRCHPPQMKLHWVECPHFLAPQLATPWPLDPLVKPVKLVLAFIINNDLCYLVEDFDVPHADV